MSAGTSAATALHALDATSARAVRFTLAGEVLPQIDERTYLHAGPPIEVGDVVGPMRGAIVGALVLEGQAPGVAEAERLLGTVRLRPCHDAGAVGAMAGIVCPRMPVVVLEGDDGSRTVAPLNEGLGRALRFGSNDADTVERLRWLGDVVAPALDAALAALEGIDVTALQAEALRRGDECHNRNVAATAAVVAMLAPELIELSIERSTAAEALRFVAGNPHFFLSLSIAAGKVVADAAARTADPGIVTAISANGREIGIRVSGCHDRWFTCDSVVGEPKLFDGYSLDDACPAMGDSFITETVGLGAFAMSAAPALSRFTGGDPTQSAALVEELRTISRGTSSRFLIPAEGFRGTPLGISVNAVARTGIAPLVNNGLAHVVAGRGQVGAGLTRLPVAPFVAASRALSGPPE